MARLPFRFNQLPPEAGFQRQTPPSVPTTSLPEGSKVIDWIPVCGPLPRASVEILTQGDAGNNAALYSRTKVWLPLSVPPTKKWVGLAATIAEVVLPWPAR